MRRANTLAAGEDRFCSPHTIDEGKSIHCGRAIMTGMSPPRSVLAHFLMLVRAPREGRMVWGVGSRHQLAPAWSRAASLIIVVDRKSSRRGLGKNIPFSAISLLPSRAST